MAVVLYVGSKKLLKGVEYSGLIPLGNAFELTEDVSVSINRSPKAQFREGARIFSHSSFTYSFDADTIVLFSREAEPNLSIIWNSRCPQSLVLVQNVESGTVCSVQALETTTDGYIEASCYVGNTKTSSADYIIKIYVNSVLVETSAPIVVLKKSEHNIYLKHVLATPLQINDDATFTVEVNKSNNSILGGQNASQIQITRIS